MLEGVPPCRTVVVTVFEDRVSVEPLIWNCSCAVLTMIVPAGVWARLNVGSAESRASTKKAGRCKTFPPLRISLAVRSGRTSSAYGAIN